MYLLAIDIGGTDIKYGILDADYSFIIKEKVTTDLSSGGLSLINQVTQLTQTIQNKYPIVGVAVSSAGVIDSDRGIVLSSTETIPYFTGLNIKESIESKAKLPVTVINDVNAMALCESRLGNHKHPSFLAMTIGTGIGGAIIYNQNVYHGHSMSAGEWGRMYLGSRSFESLASISAIVKDAKSSGLNCHDGASLFELYDKRDHLAIDIIEMFYHHLSIGLSNLIYAFNPPLIVIGGGISLRGQQFINEVKSKLKHVLPAYFYENCEIALAKHFNDAGMLGAALHYEDIHNKTISNKS